MGKRLTDFAKLYSQNNHLKNSLQSFMLNQSSQDISNNSNVVIITNTQRPKKNTYKQHQVKQLQSIPRETMGKIKQDQIRSFLQLMYREIPQYQQSKSKLSQRMYPNPLELLKSLRDTQLDNYFPNHKSHRQNDNQSYTSSEGDNQDNINHSPSSQHVDSQTSYLELGCYEFLLSQQLCQHIIEKYVAEIYEPQLQKKNQIYQRQDNGEAGCSTNIKREFNEYIEVKNMLFNHSAVNSTTIKTTQTPLYTTTPTTKPLQFQTLIRTRQLFNEHKQLQSQMLRKQILKIQLHTILDSMNEQLIKQRQSKSGYSGIGLNELALGLVQRTGVKVQNQEEYNLLINKAKFRLQKFVLNSEVDVSDKLVLECQESVTMNDSQWVFYVTEALEFGLQLSKMIEELVWEQVVREVSRMMLKRKFRLDDSQWEGRNNMGRSRDNEVNVDSVITKRRKVVSINMVVTGEETHHYQSTDKDKISDYALKQKQDLDEGKQQEMLLNDQSQSYLEFEQERPQPYHEGQLKNQQEQQQNQKQQENQQSQVLQIKCKNTLRSRQQPLSMSDNSYIQVQEPIHQQQLIQHQITTKTYNLQHDQNQSENDSYQLDDEEVEFDTDEQLDKELQKMHSDPDQQIQEIQTQLTMNSQQPAY